jgi:hypothetical protein
VETTRPNGEVIYPFYGKHPEGLLIYDRSGCNTLGGTMQLVGYFREANPGLRFDHQVVAKEGRLRSLQKL